MCNLQNSVELIATSCWYPQQVPKYLQKANICFRTEIQDSIML